jgi:hypothetical protein
MVKIKGGNKNVISLNNLQNHLAGENGPEPVLQQVNRRFWRTHY